MLRLAASRLNHTIADLSGARPVTFLPITHANFASAAPFLKRFLGSYKPYILPSNTPRPSPLTSRLRQPLPPTPAAPRSIARGAHAAHAHPRHEPALTSHDDPISALLRLINRAERLEALPRTGWLVCGVTQPESIAAHSYMVSIIALWIADHLDQPVDVASMLRIALLHDMGESMLTDLPAPVKRFVGADALQAAEERAAQIVLEDGGPAWQAAHAAYERRDTLEARIVKAADRIQLLAKALQYESQHRGDTRRFWQVDKNFEDEGLPLVRQILDCLRDMHARADWPVASFD